MEKQMNKILVVVLALLFSGCSTIEGIGKDIRDAAGWSRDKLSEPDVELIDHTDDLTDPTEEVIDEN